MIKTKKIPLFEVPLPKKGAFTIDTPDDIPRLHTLMVLSGRRGAGKGVSITTFVKQLLDYKLMDRVILISPTYHSNVTIFEPLGLNEETDVLEPTKDVVKDVIKIVEDEKAEYELYLKQRKLYKLYKQMVKGNTPLHLIDPELMLQFLDLKFFDGPPKAKYGDGSHPPRIFLIVDDCLGTPLMNPRSGLTNLCIKHRHVGKGMGISIAILVQTYSTNQGLNRAVRENCTLLCLFKCKDDNQLKKIHQEIGADINLENFDKLFKYATDKPYGSLVIDFAPKSIDKQFRAGFSEYITI